MSPLRLPYITVGQVKRANCTLLMVGKTTTFDLHAKKQMGKSTAVLNRTLSNTTLYFTRIVRIKIYLFIRVLINVFVDFSDAMK